MVALLENSTGCYKAALLVCVLAFHSVVPRVDKLESLMDSTSADWMGCESAGRKVVLKVYVRAVL